MCSTPSWHLRRPRRPRCRCRRARIRRVSASGNVSQTPAFSTSRRWGCAPSDGAANRTARGRRRLELGMRRSGLSALAHDRIRHGRAHYGRPGGSRGDRHRASCGDGAVPDPGTGRWGEAKTLQRAPGGVRQVESLWGRRHCAMGIWPDCQAPAATVSGSRRRRAGVGPTGGRSRSGTLQGPAILAALVVAGEENSGAGSRPPTFSTATFHVRHTDTTGHRTNWERSACGPEGSRHNGHLLLQGGKTARHCPDMAGSSGVPRTCAMPTGTGWSASRRRFLRGTVPWFDRGTACATRVGPA